MATTTTRKLRLVFIDANGEKVTQNWSNTKQSVGRSDVRSFMAAIITNKSIFTKQPNSEYSATEITTTKETFDLA